MKHKTHSNTTKHSIQDDASLDSSEIAVDSDSSFSDRDFDRSHADKPVAKTAANTQQNRLKIKRTQEIGGPKGLEPTRYGDWESKGRCYDF